jgi:hypothetical protein
MKARFAAAVLSAVVTSWGAGADEEAAVKTGRELLQQHQDSIVLVKAVAKMRGAGEMGFAIRDQGENERGADGVVVDPSGLVMVAYSQLDVSSMLRGMSVRIGDENKKLDIKTDLSDIKIRLASGAQIPARLVFKDEELGVGFVAPREELKEADRKAMKALPMDDAAAVLQVLDRVVALGRLPEAMDFEPCLDLERVQAVVKKPRTMYVANVSPGLPVYNEQGKLAGFSVIRAAEGEGGHGGTPVILPIAEIRKLVDQAREAVKKGDAGAK